MTREEAVKRINEHIAIHQYNEPHAIRIAEALQMAVDVLQKQISKPVRKSEHTRTGMGAEFNDYICPTCGTFLKFEPEGDFIIRAHEGKLSRCTKCGQVVLWKKVEE